MRIEGKKKVIDMLKENLANVQCVEIITPDGIWESRGSGRFYRLTEMYLKSENTFKHRYYCSEAPYPFCTFCGEGVDDEEYRCKIETINVDELINRVNTIDEGKSYVLCTVINN